MPAIFENCSPLETVFGLLLGGIISFGFTFIFLFFNIEDILFRINQGKFMYDILYRSFICLLILHKNNMVYYMIIIIIIDNYMMHINLVYYYGVNVDIIIVTDL